jgi:hypothetical protein
MLALEEERQSARPLDGRMRRSLLADVRKVLQHDLQVATRKRINATLLNH